MKQYFSVLKGDRVFCSAHKIVSVFSGLKLTLPNQMSRKKSPFLCPATRKGKFLCMDPSCVIAILQVLILPLPVVFSPPPPHVGLPFQTVCPYRSYQFQSSLFACICERKKSWQQFDLSSLSINQNKNFTLLFFWTR